MATLRHPWVLAALLVGVAVALRLAGHATGRHVEGGILIGDAGAYDRHSRWLFGSLFRGIERDIVASAPPDARVRKRRAGHRPWTV